MKKTQFITTLFILLVQFLSAQNIQFISEKTAQPLTKVSVFDKNGNIVAVSDINGKIAQSTLNKDFENFQLVYDNIIIAKLSFNEINKTVVKLNDRVKDIEPVVIKNSKPAKYIILKGNFNSYVTLNSKLNCYVDGIISYVFDNKTKKLKRSYLEQYRIYRLQQTEFEEKQTNNYDYQGFLSLPQLKNIGNITEYKNKKATIKELKSRTKDEIEISGSALQEKEFKLFGYRMYDIRGISNHSYEKNSQKTLRDFLETNEIFYVKLKHKSEPNYNQIIGYRNFYPTELDFSDDDKADEKIKFNKNNSNYSRKYWEEPSFPNMQSVFSSFFKDDLKEKENLK